MYRTPVEPPLELSSNDALRTTGRSRIVAVLIALAAAPVAAGVYLHRDPPPISLGMRVAPRAPASERPLLSLADLIRVTPISARAVDFTRLATEVHSHRELAFAFDNPVTRARERICTATDASPEVACRNIAADGSEEPSFPVARDTEAPPSVFPGPTPSPAAHATYAGPAVVRDDLFGWAYRRRDGRTVTLTYRASYGARLRFAIDDADERMLSAPPGIVTGPLYYAAALVPGFVLWRGISDAGELRLLAQPIGTSSVGVHEDLGPIGDWYIVGSSQQIFSCHSGDALVVALKGTPNTEGTYRWYVAIHRNGSWTVPAAAEEFDNLTCRQAEASLTRVTGAANDVIKQWRCAEGRCDGREARVPPSVLRSAVTTDSGIVTIARFDRRLYLRVGTIDELPNKPDRLLFDGGDAGADGWLGGFELLPLGGAAALVVSTTRGTFVVRIDGSGRATPLDAAIKT
jgi:hypothetical protein